MISGGRLEAERSALDTEIVELSRRLDDGSSMFILVHRYQTSLSDREAPERDTDAVAERIREYGIKRVDAEGNVLALEQRCLEYLRELRIPNLSPAEFQVHINRSNLPA